MHMQEIDSLDLYGIGIGDGLLIKMYTLNVTLRKVDCRSLVLISHY